MFVPVLAKVYCWKPNGHVAHCSAAKHTDAHSGICAYLGSYIGSM